MSPPSSSSPFAAAFAQLPSAEDLLRSVVTIHADKARGSGFVIDSGGYLVTNSQVIEGAEAAAIWTEDGEFFNRVVVVADDPERDLALLRVATATAPTIDDGHYPTAQEIAEAWNNTDGRVDYFYNNREHGIRTFQDAAIEARLKAHGLRS